MPAPASIQLEDSSINDALAAWLAASLRRNQLYMNADIERQIEMDFLRATKFAAFNTLQWLGKGQKEKADEAACDAIRGMFDQIDIAEKW